MDQKPTPMATLLGGVEHIAYFANGTTEPVKVRQLAVRHYEKYLALQGDESKLVEFVCDKEEGWADTLIMESYEALVKSCEEVNADFFSRWFIRVKARMERLGVKPNDLATLGLQTGARK